MWFLEIMVDLEQFLLLDGKKKEKPEERKPILKDNIRNELKCNG